MLSVKLEFDKDTFDKQGAWMLRPEDMVENYGKVNFSTIQFFLENGAEYCPEGGGTGKYINVPHAYANKDTVVVFEADCLFPDPWIIRHRTVFVGFELHT